MRISIGCALILLATSSAAFAYDCGDATTYVEACPTVQLCRNKAVKLPKQCVRRDVVDSLQQFFQFMARESMFSDRREFGVPATVWLHHEKDMPRSDLDDREYDLQVFDRPNWVAFLRRPKKASLAWEIDEYWKKQILPRMRAQGREPFWLPSGEDVIQSLPMEDLKIEEDSCPALVERLRALEQIPVHVPRLVFEPNEAQRVTVTVHARMIEVGVSHWGGAISVSSNHTAPWAYVFEWGMKTMEALEPCWARSARQKRSPNTK